MPDTQRRLKYLAQYDKWRVTTHGDNPWTGEALRNVATMVPQFEAALALLGGTLSSGYRCARINRLVGGASTSRHMRGLALDIVPKTMWTIQEASRDAWDAAVAGKLGMVQQVIWEPTWVHIGWYAVDEKDADMSYLQNVGGKYVALAHAGG